MRTTLDIDGEALKSAMRLSPGKTKTAVINAALREYARRRWARGLIEFQGRVQWEGRLDELRQREGHDR